MNTLLLKKFINEIHKAVFEGKQYESFKVSELTNVFDTFPLYV